MRAPGRAAATLRAGRRVALLLAFAALVLGLGDRPAPAAHRLPELAVVVAVDRTTSMSALDDPTGSRITAVRRDLVRLADHLDPAEFSVVTFGHDAEVALPFTSDRQAYADTVAGLQVEPARGSTGSSLDRVAALLHSELEAAAAQRPAVLPVVVLVSDGEDTAPGSTQPFTSLAALSRASVVLGYGTTHGGVMPLERVKVDASPPPPAQAGPLVTDPATGRPARSRLDLANLHAVATAMGGSVVRCNGSQDLTAVATALEQRATRDVSPGAPQRQLRWRWALLLLVLSLPELRAGWRRYLEARRAVLA